MSEYTTRQILDMIEGNEGSEFLDLSEADLAGIDLSIEIIQAELREARKDNPEMEPVWVSASGGIRLSQANLQEACLWGANLRKAFLWVANLQGADLWAADLQGADLREADLRETVLLTANLQGATLRGANLQGTSFHGARLDHTELDREGLGPAIAEELTRDYDEARDAYLRLKQNFDDIGDYAASAWAYQKERQMEKKCHAPWRARSIYGRAELGDASPPRVFLFYARHTVKWIFDWIVEYLCGYGENPIRVLLWMALSLFGFSTYYWHLGGVWLIEPSKGPIATASSFWHYLIYSLGAFTTTQFATFQAADDRVRLVTGIQAIWGIFLAGLLGFVVANKIRRS